MTFIIKGPMVGGKNMIQTAFINGRKIRYPTQHFKVWRADVLRQIYSQRPGLNVLFKEPVWFNVVYTPADRRNRDMPGMMDALFHVLEHANVVADDGLFKECLGWAELKPDPKNPGLKIEIGAL
jgi:Holliday junction resolvase RusA-like endonuclease